MIISYMGGGIGNQLFHYAVGRRLAHKWNTELKLDLTAALLSQKSTVSYTLNQFNIKATFATPEETRNLKKFSVDNNLGDMSKASSQEILNWPDNIYLYNTKMHDVSLFADIADILKEELTLKNPLSSEAKVWEKKILSAECSVSMHFRHGDILYNPFYQEKFSAGMSNIPPLDYYYTCLNDLKQQYKNITVFVFSNNMQFIKEILHLDVPTEFVDNLRLGDETFYTCSAQDVEELYLMSLCKHNICQMGSFAWWAAWLNQNPNKKIFRPFVATPKSSQRYSYSLKSVVDSGEWINIPFDKDNQLDVKMKPFFSVLLVVNNDILTIAETLDSLIKQNFRYYEIIIIDNASTDGSGEICRQVAEGRENIKLVKLWSKVKNSVAWNKATSIAQGYYLCFLKGNDRFLFDSLANLYYTTDSKASDITNFFSWLVEDDNGEVILGDKKYSEQRDVWFQKETKTWILTGQGKAVAKLLMEKKINSFLATKTFSRDFLTKNEIKFDEILADDEAELFFQVESFFKSKWFLHKSKAIYIAPRKQ